MGYDNGVVFSLSFTRWSTGIFSLGGVAAGAAIPIPSPNHSMHTSLSREVILAYAEVMGHALFVLYWAELLQKPHYFVDLHSSCSF
jgi:hypothetical protein